MTESHCAFKTRSRSKKKTISSSLSVIIDYQRLLIWKIRTTILIYSILEKPSVLEAQRCNIPTVDLNAPRRKLKHPVIAMLVESLLRIKG